MYKLHLHVYGSVYIYIYIYISQLRATNNAFFFLHMKCGGKGRRRSNEGRDGNYKLMVIAVGRHEGGNLFWQVIC